MFVLPSRAFFHLSDHSRLVKTRHEIMAASRVGTYTECPVA